MNRRLQRIHRWLGSLLGVLVLAWLLSGVVMMYVGFPSLTRAERLAGAGELPALGWTVDPAEMARRAGAGDGASPVLLGEFLGRAVYRLRPEGGAPWSTFLAEEGSPLPEVTSAQAAEVARRFAARSGLTTGNVRVTGPIPLDQWTVSSPLDALRPFHRVSLGDVAGTELYVSVRTGEVVRDTGRRERAWNWVGAVTHWVYPAILRQHVLAWRTTGRVLSLGALMLVLTGLALAWRRASRNGRGFQFRGVRGFHTWAGVVFGVPLAAWLLSGFLSFRIVPLFDDGEPTQAQLRAWQGLDVAPASKPLGWEAARAAAGLPHPIVAAEWRRDGAGELLVVR
ncbi:MAG: PepSY domain-containing protein, partial [Verrucomicrobiales bacterium]|nr:PepSY domain-containing protein [Verrucomicrobiales bacterium]